MEAKVPRPPFRLVDNAFLEFVTQCELHYARSARGRRDNSEVASAAQGSRGGSIKTRVVESVEGIPTEFQPLALRPRQAEGLHDAHINCAVRRSLHDVSCANSSALREGECRQ